MITTRRQADVLEVLKRGGIVRLSASGEIPFLWDPLPEKGIGVQISRATFERMLREGQLVPCGWGIVGALYRLRWSTRNAKVKAKP